MGVVSINPFNTNLTNIFSSYELGLVYIIGIIYVLQYFIDTISYENILISIISGTMIPFGILLIFEIFNSSYIQPLLLYTFSLYYSYYTETMDIVLLLSLSGLAIIFFSYIIACTYSFFKKCSKNKVVTILRGVPGIGKTSYIASVEYEYCNSNDYKVCYSQYYYGKGYKYKYRPNETKQAELWSLLLFIKSIFRRIPRIYVVSTFEKLWQYEIYVYLAKLMKYNVKIIELECINERYLRHFQQRSTRSVPLTRALRIFNEWEYDERAILQDPYIEPDLLGDCIPTYDNTTSMTLDIDLDEYRKGNNKKDNNNKLDNRIRTDYFITNITECDKEIFGL
jgi:hypothetical protein